MRRSLKQRSPMKYEKAASTDQGTIKMPKDFVAKATNRLSGSGNIWDPRAYASRCFRSLSFSKYGDI